MKETAAHRLDKARALLLSMASEHQGDWYQCRHCLAHEEAETAPAGKLLREFVAEYDRLMAIGQARLLKRQRYLEKRASGRAEGRTP